MKSGENEERIGKGITLRACLSSCLPWRALHTHPLHHAQESPDPFCLATLAMTFPTPALDLTTAVEFTTALNSTPDWSLEKTQAFQWRQTLQASWKKPLRPHTITTQFTRRASSVRIIPMSLLFIVTGAPAQPNTSMGSDCKSQIKTDFSHVSRSSEVDHSSLSQCPRNPELKGISVCLQTEQKLYGKSCHSKFS